MLMRRLGKVLITLGFALALPVATYAIELNYVGEFNFEFGRGPGGMAFDEASGNLYVADDENPTVIHVVNATNGSRLASFSTGVNYIEAAAFLPNGNLLVVSDAPSFREFTTAGTNVTGTALGSVSSIPFASGDPEGVAYHPDRNSIFVVDGYYERIQEYSLTGDLLRDVDARDIDNHLTNPEGLTIDPKTGNLFIVDDGSRFFFEITVDLSTVVTKINLKDLTDAVAQDEYSDPECITIDPATGRVYIGFDNDEKVVIFDIPGYVPVPPTTPRARLPEGVRVSM